MTFRSEIPCIRVALIDDSRELLSALGEILRNEAGIQFVGGYSSIAEALSGLISNPAEVVLTDLRMPEISGIDGIPMLRTAFPESLFLILTLSQDGDDVFQALSNGADGYLLKSDPPGRILAGIREARAGGAPMSPLIARRVIQTFQKPSTNSTAPVLSSKEMEILTLLRSGAGYKGAANQLSVSIDTVRSHVRNIYQKLKVHSLVEAISKISPRDEPRAGGSKRK
jgi:DNA-binding NarL/FixJ family response regulator